MVDKYCTNCAVGIKVLGKCLPKLRRAKNAHSIMIFPLSLANAFKTCILEQKFTRMRDQAFQLVIWRENRISHDLSL